MLRSRGNLTVTYDHRLVRTGHPVRSAIHKHQIGRLVVGWVTTSEYLLFVMPYTLFGLSIKADAYVCRPFFFTQFFYVTYLTPAQL
ncbi:hypothetical protein WAI453_002461 [Rhynchosporium graminicola]